MAKIEQIKTAITRLQTSDVIDLNAFIAQHIQPSTPSCSNQARPSPSELAVPELRLHLPYALGRI